MVVEMEVGIVHSGRMYKENTVTGLSFLNLRKVEFREKRAYLKQSENVKKYKVQKKCIIYNKYHKKRSKAGKLKWLDERNM